LVGGSIPSAPAKFKFMKNPFRSTRIFFGEMVGELQKATWPTKTELRDSTIVVVVAAAILGVFTSISDFSLISFVDLFTKLVS
jgi:preprotein translocase subunit SecE